RAPGAPAAGDCPKVAAAQVRTTSPGPARARILLVEDDRELASVLRRHLTDEGFTVDVASDGEWAVRILTLADCPVDAVLLDLMLPGLGGRDVCRRLRSAGCWLPVLMVTALGDTADRIQGFADGADDYLPKPFSLDELVMRLRALLRRTAGIGQSPAGTTLEVGDLRLDLLHRRCWRGETELSLTPREFEVLEFFMRRAGLVISRQSILEAVWGANRAVSANTVDQYLALLRRKIDAPFGRADLETLPRIGYRLRIPWTG
ncbi:MAG: response regulator transcription factor, partial [Streptosporangiaceae bacterium]